MRLTPYERDLIWCHRVDDPQNIEGNAMVDFMRGDRIVSAKELKKLIPYSDPHVKRMEDAGTFPKRIRLGEHRVGWSLMALQAWVDEREKGETPAQDEHEKEEAPAQG